MATETKPQLLSTTGFLPKISIVTPSYNQAQFLEETLHSVKRQAYPSVEHIVMDGGSSDGSVEILKRYSAQPGWEHLNWISEKDGGQGNALNKGFRIAGGDIIGWLNSDDTYAEGCFEKVAREATATPDIQVFYGDWNWIDESGRVTQVRREISFSHFILFYNRICFLQSSGALFLRRSVFDNGHFLDERYHCATDYEFYLRLAKAGVTFKHLPHILGSFRWHGESKSTRDVQVGLQEFKEIKEKYADLSKWHPNPRIRAASLSSLTALATLMRWSEKMIRGHYFRQFK
jgi:glycosyltransferase involved in cell wall biosynthesis